MTNSFNWFTLVKGGVIHLHINGFKEREDGISIKSNESN